MVGRATAGSHGLLRNSDGAVPQDDVICIKNATVRGSLPPIL